jgi:hypothetical protein
LNRAKRLAVQGRLPWPTPQESIYKALLGQRLSSGEFLALDDVSVMHCLKLWMGVDDPMLVKLCGGLLDRKLYKTIDLSGLEEGELTRAKKIAAEAVSAGKGDEAYDLFYDEPADTPYEIYDGTSPAADILVRDREGILRSFASISPLTAVLSRHLMFRRLHVSAEYRTLVLRGLSDGGVDFPR